MLHHKKMAKPDYLDVEHNQEAVLRLFRSYFRSHQSSGKMLDDFPDFFLVKPIVLKDPELATRDSDKLILEDCVHRAQTRNGYVGVSKWRNPKLNYYWLEMSVFPFMLGDEVNQNNEAEFYYLLQQFIAYTQAHPKVYGDLVADTQEDADLALMLKGIAQRAERLTKTAGHYPIEQLLQFNPNWPLAEVKKLLHTLKGSELDWCELFFEHIMYVMGHHQRA